MRRTGLPGAHSAAAPCAEGEPLARRGDRALRIAEPASRERERVERDGRGRALPPLRARAQIVEPTARPERLRALPERPAELEVVLVTEEIPELVEGALVAGPPLDGLAEERHRVRVTPLEVRRERADE